MSKLVPLAELPTLVEPGQSVALGGAWLSNHPMAAVRELIRAQVKDLHVIDSLASLDVDLLIGAGLLSELTFSMVSLEAFGLAPHFRRAVQAGELRINEVSGVALNVAIEAGARNLPFLPMRDIGRSELPARQPGFYAAIDCPFTGEQLLGIRAQRPDVAIVHVLRADAEGNCQYDGPLAIDPELARAASRVIVTCEEVVDGETIREHPDSTKIPGFLVDSVIEAPFGAHPTTHIPRYGFDGWAVMEYVEAFSADECAEYLARLAAESEEQYRDRVLDSERREVLRVLGDPRLAEGVT